MVPGAGHHSGGGGAKLKPAIAKFLKDKGLAFEVKNAGTFVVTLA